MRTDAAAALAGAAAVMVTHEHADRLDVGAVRTALQVSPGLTLWANPQVTAIHDAILNDNGLGLMTRMLLVAAARAVCPWPG